MGGSSWRKIEPRREYIAGQNAPCLRSQCRNLISCFQKQFLLSSASRRRKSIFGLQTSAVRSSEKAFRTPWLPGASQRTLCFSLCPTIKKTTSWGFSTPTCCSFGKPRMKYHHLHLQLGGRKFWSAKHKPTKNLHPARAAKNTAKGGSFQCQRLPSRSRPSSYPLG